MSRGLHDNLKAHKKEKMSDKRNIVYKGGDKHIWDWHAIALYSFFSEGKMFNMLGHHFPVPLFVMLLST